MATWYDMEGIARDEVPDGTPVPDGRWLDPMGGYYYQYGYPQPAPPPPPPQYTEEAYGGPPMPDENSYQNTEPSYYYDPAPQDSYQSDPLFGYTPPSNYTPTGPTAPPSTPAQNMIQLYTLEGTPLEQIPEGSPVPSGRWTTPNGGALWQSGQGPDQGGQIAGQTTTNVFSPPPPTPTPTVTPTPTPTSTSNNGIYQGTNLLNQYGNNPVSGLGTNQGQGAGVITPTNTTGPVPAGGYTNFTNSNGQITGSTSGVPSWWTPQMGSFVQINQIPPNGGTPTTETPDTSVTNSPYNLGAGMGLGQYRDLKSEGANTLQAQMLLAPQMYQQYAQYAPLYAQTDLATMRNQLFGSVDAQRFLAQHPEFREGYINHGGLNGGQQWLDQAVANSTYLNQADIPRGGGIFGINQALTKAANDQTIQSNTALRQGNVNDAMNLGGTALSTLQTLNPNQYAALNQANAQAGQIGMSGYQDALRSTFLQGPQYQQVGGQTVSANGITAPTQSGVAAINAPQIGSYQSVNAPTAQANTGFSGVNQPVLDVGLQTAQNRLLNSTGPSDIQTSLENKARSNLALGGALSQEDTRNAQQAAREAWAARGLVNSRGAVAAEVLNRDALSRQRENERIAQAQGIDATGFAQRQQGFQNALGLSDAARGYAGLGLQAQQSNLGAQMQGNQLATQTSLANQDAGLRAQLANQSAAQQMGVSNQNAALQAALANQSSAQSTQSANQNSLLQALLANQQNAYNSQLASANFGQQAALANQGAYQQALQQNNSLGTTLAGLDYSRAQQNYGNILSNAQLQSANAFNPFATITSVGTANSGVNNSLFSQGAANSSGALGNQGVQNMFNPFNAYSQDLYNTNANAMWSAQQNAANRSTSTKNSLIGAIGQLGGAAIGAGIFGCWVAREVYGADNPLWLVFRKWMFEQAPAELRELYLRNGESLALWLRDHPEFKAPLRKWMDSRIASMVTL